MKPTDQQIKQAAEAFMKPYAHKLHLGEEAGHKNDLICFADYLLNEWPGAISQMQPEWVAVRTAIEDRIKQLREADAKFCYDRWENKNISQMERNMAREASNSVTLARQELESILELFTPTPNR